MWARIRPPRRATAPACPVAADSGQPPALGRMRSTAARGVAASTAAASAVRKAAGSAMRGGDRTPPAPPKPKRSESARRFASSKRDEREQRLARRRLRNQLIGGGLAVLAVLLVVGSIVLYRSDAFAVRRVDVTGNRHLIAARVVQIAGLPPGTTLLRLPAAEMEARLRTNPWVLDATVERVFPDGIKIVLAERRPVAAVDLGPRGRWIVDATGTLIATGTADPKAPVPLVREIPAIAGPRPGLPAASAQLANAVKVLDGLTPDLARTVRFVNARTVDETDLHHRPGCGDT